MTFPSAVFSVFRVVFLQLTAKTSPPGTAPSGGKHTPEAKFLGLALAQKRTWDLDYKLRLPTASPHAVPPFRLTLIYKQRATDSFTRWLGKCALTSLISIHNFYIVANGSSGNLLGNA